MKKHKQKEYKPHRSWTEGELDFLRTNHGKMTNREIETILDRSPGTVYNKSRKMGLIDTPLSPSRKWVPDDVERLAELWGNKPIHQIAKILGRTETALILKTKRLGLGGATKFGEAMPANVVAVLLGVDRHTVTDYWIRKCGLKARPRAMRGIRRMLMVDFADLMKWLQMNTDKWDSRRVELFALGCEPEWLKEKRCDDLAQPARKFQKWTPFEDARLIKLYKPGDLSFDEIAAQMHRSSSAVQHRIRRLDVWGSGKYVGERTNGRQDMALKAAL